MKTKKTTKPKIIKKITIIAISVLALLAVASLVFYLYQNNLTSDNGLKQRPDAKTSVVDGPNQTSAVKGNTPTDAPKISTDVTPVNPTGTFVSNHRPNLSGNPAPSTESSTCTTTPGATCTITFTKVNTVNSLEPKITDSDGNTNWDWTLTEAGLTEGSWTVTALATNGDKTVTVTDSMLLVVEQ